MIDRHSLNRRGSSDLAGTAKWVNTSGETVPAYGVVQFRTNFAAGYNQAKKPNGETGLYFASGGVDILDTKAGESLTWNGARLVLLDGDPTVGTVVGPTDGSWAMSEEGTGFVVMHQAVDGIGSVERVGGGGGGGLSIIGNIEEVVCDAYSVLNMYCWVTVTDFTGECDTQIPGQITDIYDQHFGMVKVYQKCDTFTAYYTASQLKPFGEPGKIIEAGWFYPREGYCDPRWLVRRVCGEPRCR